MEKWATNDTDNVRACCTLNAMLCSLWRCPSCGNARTTMIFEKNRFQRWVCTFLHCEHVSSSILWKYRRCACVRRVISCYFALKITKKKTAQFWVCINCGFDVKNHHFNAAWLTMLFTHNEKWFWRHSMKRERERRMELT